MSNQQRLLPECPWPFVCLCCCSWRKINHVSITVLLTGTIDPRPNTAEKRRIRWVVKTVIKGDGTDWAHGIWPLMSINTYISELCITKQSPDYLVMIFTQHNVASSQPQTQIYKHWPKQATRTQAAVYLPTPCKIWACHAISVCAKTTGSDVKGKNFNHKHSTFLDSKQPNRHQDSSVYTEMFDSEISCSLMKRFVAGCARMVFIWGFEQDWFKANYSNACHNI